MFGRHGKELARSIDRQEYERTPEGVYFPKMGALLFGEFCVTSKYGVRRQRNLLCNGGLTLITQMVLGNDAFNGYIAPFGFDATPTVDWSEYSLYFDAGEHGGSPHGYSEGGRQAWVAVNEGGNIAGNTASPAAFTIVTASSLDVYGYAVIYTTGAKQSGKPVASFNPNIIGEEVLQLGPVTTPFGVIRGTTEGPGYGVGPYHEWLDPSGDNIYDSGLGYWTSVAGGNLELDVSTRTQYLFSATRMATPPETYGNGDPLSITYTVQFS